MNGTRQPPPTFQLAKLERHIVGELADGMLWIRLDASLLLDLVRHAIAHDAVTIGDLKQRETA